MERASGIREPCLVCGRWPSDAPAPGANPRETPISGILNVDKPSGLTSHDVVDRIRKAADVRRVGHAGTLDPAALGVLLICVGQATRVSQYLMQSRKSYEARIRLGITTDTGDAEGKVVHSISEVNTTRQQVEDALTHFRGRIEQMPPMYSALKHKGTALYKLARQGIEVERSPRVVEIHDLRVADWEPPSFGLAVECSSGTYIRTLAGDLGEMVGTGAHLERLVRVACGTYTLETALSLHTAEQSLSRGHWRQIQHPLDEARMNFEAFVVNEEAETRIRSGQQFEGPEPQAMPFCRTYTLSGEFVALLEYDRVSRVWRPRKVFNLHEATA